MFVMGGAETSFREGTTQGYPLAMPLHALAMTPFIRQLSGPVTQAGYAEDAQGEGFFKAMVGPDHLQRPNLWLLCQ